MNTSLFTNWLLGSDESVGRAFLTHSCPIDHVVSRWTGDAGRASLGRAQGAVSTLWGDTSDHVGDVDGIDLCHVSTVFPLLREEKDLIGHQLRHSTQRTVVVSASRDSLYHIFSHCRHLINYSVQYNLKVLILECLPATSYSHSTIIQLSYRTTFIHFHIHITDIKYCQYIMYIYTWCSCSSKVILNFLMISSRLPSRVSCCSTKPLICQYREHPTTQPGNMKVQELVIINSSDRLK